jgi:hypothetical protein
VPPRLRRLVFAVLVGTAAARLFALGQQLGWRVVGPATGRVVGTALLAWLLHVAAHEAGHWLAAVRNDFEVRAVRLGPFVLDLFGRRVTLGGRDLGGGVTSFPRGVGDLRARLRRVALAGPLATLALTALTGAAYVLAGGRGPGSTLGIGLVMGLFVLVTTLLPAWLLPRRPAGGTDLQRALGSRAILAHWTHAALLQGLGQGRRVSTLVSRAQLDALLPEGGPTLPLTLAALLHRLEVGPLEGVRARLDEAQANLPPDAPDWLVADLALVSGCFAALVERDLPLAEGCLGRMRQAQGVPWFSALLEACLAQARGVPSDALDRWQAGLADFPHRALALAANDWVLKRLVDHHGNGGLHAPT